MGSSLQSPWLTIPYRLPSSFPYGGMENPCLTFVTPTLLAGDRSLVDVVAHEISHRCVQVFAFWRHNHIFISIPQLDGQLGDNAELGEYATMGKRSLLWR